MHDTLALAENETASVVARLEAAIREVDATPMPPEGWSTQHKATRAYILGVLTAARKLQGAIAAIN